VRFILLLLSLVAGTGAGLGLTWLAAASGHGFGAVRIGAWTAWPQSGTASADPYARAAFARSGELPLERVDGLAFETTATDDRGVLDGRCDTLIAGRVPRARFWTLTVYDPRGRLIENEARRYGFNSTEIVWNADGTFAITLAPRARGGNWLPTGGLSSIVAVLRLYDAPIGLAARSDEPVEMPAVSQVRCPW
jgi:hypothetical protein